MIQFIMKIPSLEEGNRILGEDILLAHPQAVEMAKANVAWQADNTYFDAELEFWFNGELFLAQGTTDAWGLWRDLVNAIQKRGKHPVSFLDCDLDMTIEHETDYEFLYVEKTFEWDDNNICIGITKETISSGPLPKEDVEAAVKEAFFEYADFILQNDIPIAEEYKEDIAERRAALLK